MINKLYIIVNKLYTSINRICTIIDDKKNIFLIVLKIDLKLNKKFKNRESPFLSKFLYRLYRIIMPQVSL